MGTRCWFGGRMIQQLVRYGFIEGAYRNLRPMAERVLRAGNPRFSRRSGPSHRDAASLGSASQVLKECSGPICAADLQAPTSACAAVSCWRRGKTKSNAQGCDSYLSLRFMRVDRIAKLRKRMRGPTESIRARGSDRVDDRNAFKRIGNGDHEKRVCSSSNRLRFFHFCASRNLPRCF